MLKRTRQDSKRGFSSCTGRSFEPCNSSCTLLENCNLSYYFSFFVPIPLYLWMLRFLDIANSILNARFCIRLQIMSAQVIRVIQILNIFQYLSHMQWFRDKYRAIRSCIHTGESSDKRLLLVIKLPRNPDTSVCSLHPQADELACKRIPAESSARSTRLSSIGFWAPVGRPLALVQAGKSSLSIYPGIHPFRKGTLLASLLPSPPPLGTSLAIRVRLVHSIPIHPHRLTAQPESLYQR